MAPESYYNTYSSKCNNCEEKIQPQNQTANIPIEDSVSSIESNQPNNFIQIQQIKNQQQQNFTNPGIQNEIITTTTEIITKTKSQSNLHTQSTQQQQQMVMRNQIINKQINQQFAMQNNHQDQRLHQQGQQLFENNPFLPNNFNKNQNCGNGQVFHGGINAGKPGRSSYHQNGANSLPISHKNSGASTPNLPGQRPIKNFNNNNANDRQFQNKRNLTFREKQQIEDVIHNSCSVDKESSGSNMNVNNNNKKGMFGVRNTHSCITTPQNEERNMSHNNNNQQRKSFNNNTNLNINTQIPQQHQAQNQPPQSSKDSTRNRSTSNIKTNNSMSIEPLEQKQPQKLIPNQP